MIVACPCAILYHTAYHFPSKNISLPEAVMATTSTHVTQVRALHSNSGGATRNTESFLATISSGSAESLILSFSTLVASTRLVT